MLSMKKGKNVMKNKTKKNIQKKAMKDKKKKAKDKKNLERAAAGDPKRKPRTWTMLKGPLMPDVSLMPEDSEEYYKTFQLTCMIIPPRTGSAAKRIVVGVVP